MKIYLDLCCLKRPFDDWSVARTHLEAQAVLSIQRTIEEGRHAFVRSAAHDLENAPNPVAARRARVEEWLSQFPLPPHAPAAVEARTTELIATGFKPSDARHLAWAETLRADVFVTTDDRLRSRASRQPPPVTVRVTGPVELVQEEKP